MANWKQGKSQFSSVKTATSGGTLALTASSKQFQILTGTSSHTVTMPNATTVGSGGILITVINESTGIITVNDFTNALLSTVPAGGSIDFFLTSVSTSAGTWRIASYAGGSGGGEGSQSPGSVIQVGTRAIFSGGATSAGSNSTSSVIDYVTIATLANAASFGSLAVAKDLHIGCSNSITGIFAGGYNGSTQVNNIDSLTIATLSNTTSFGTLTSARYGLGACSNATFGIFAGGYNGSYLATIDYITIATAANAASFGSLTNTRTGTVGCGSTTRGVFGGGYNGSTVVSTIDYVTIASVGNATSFGSLATSRTSPAACSNAIRGLFAGGDTTGNSNNTNVIDYVTIATTGNATSFGNLSVIKREMGAAASPINALFGGGGDGTAGAGAPTVYSLIEYVAIATTGNSLTFGNLTVSRKELASFSNCHGGL